MKVPVYLTTGATYYLGEVDIETQEDFDDAAEALWKSKGYDYPTLCHQCSDAELGDWEIEDSSAYFKDKT